VTHTARIPKPPALTIVTDEGNPAQLGTVAWQRRKAYEALRLSVRLGRDIRYTPAKELRKLYRHYRAFDVLRVSNRASNPEHDINPTMLIALELHAALPYLTYTRRVAFEAVVIGRERLPNLITHRYEWKWLEAPLTMTAAADLLDTNERYVRNLVDRSLDTLVARIYETLPG
jgi:hypothetical protein